MWISLSLSLSVRKKTWIASWVFRREERYTIWLQERLKQRREIDKEELKRKRDV
jgi:hypothetical protein